MNFEFEKPIFSNDALLTKFNEKLAELNNTMVSLFGGDQSDRNLRRFVTFVCNVITTKWFPVYMKRVLAHGPDDPITPKQLKEIASLTDVDNEMVVNLAGNATDFVLGDTTLPSVFLDIKDRFVAKYGRGEVEYLVRQIAVLEIAYQSSYEYELANRLYAKQQEVQVTNEAAEPWKLDVVNNENVRIDTFSKIQTLLNKVMTEVGRSDKLDEQDSYEIHTMLLEIGRKVEECKERISNAVKSENFDFGSFDGKLLKANKNGFLRDALKVKFSGSVSMPVVTIVFKNNKMIQISDNEAYRMRDYYGRLISSGMDVNWALANMLMHFDKCNGLKLVPPRQ